MDIKKTFALAVLNHQKKNIQVAQDLYKKILKIDLNHIDAHNNLGVIFQGLGESLKAKECFEKAITINPNFANAHNNLGAALKELDESLKAKKCFEKAITINPNYPEAYLNLGIIFVDLKENQKAKECLEKTIVIDPNNIVAHNNLGIIFKELREHQKAKECFKKAIKTNPNFIDAHNNLGIIFKELEDYHKAIECFEKAITIDPNFANAHNNLGIIFQNLGEHQKAKECFEKAITIDPNLVEAQKNISLAYIRELNDFEKAISSSYKSLKMEKDEFKFINQSISLFRLKHDVQQAKYLIAKNYKIDGVDQFQKVGDKILGRKENNEGKNNYDKKILLTSDEINALLPFYKSDFTYKPKTILGSCINPNKNWQDVEDEYFNSSNQIMYIDDFLSDEALIELREFCLVSKVWNKEYYNPFLGAYSESGFISPMHLQIAIELQQKLPKLFGPHKLGQFWGFKYDSTLGKGINIHADFALHNLNFWITPDEYNNNKNGGGLKVYDAPAPDHWTFQDYNARPDKIYKFLKENDAKCTNIPHKYNRAVLFNSAYFHETDEIDFKDEYEGRRINNTYLFGNRLVEQIK
ncbi:tetratricopeptide repeat protein [Candidatus Pelagibacter sp. Uisw_104]|uniref:tetratricopeptide repeat protein n=1 Tax=Candidatus Pelagibacter sp. Uisw_104 TaxID=3230983 RepID=UPI0039E8956F